MTKLELLRPVIVNQTPPIKPESELMLYSTAGARDNWSLDGSPVCAGTPGDDSPGVPLKVE